MYRVYKYFLTWPLYWTICFMSIEEYKSFLRERYGKDKKMNDQRFGGISTFITAIDELVDYALEDFEQMFGEHDALRTAPMIFPLPKGEDNSAAFAVILKRGSDGDTFVYSTVKLKYLE